MLSRLPADYWTEQDAGIAMAAMRARRDELLAASDFTQLDDADKVKKAAWADYRKQLRDLPATQHPLNVVWPDLPQSLQTLI